MHQDKNKDIENIHYNHLNLPDSITVTGKGTVKYTYDAAGNKLRKVVTEGSKVTTTLYLAGNYVNDTLQFIGTEEGRARIKDSALIVYDYFIKDHLGNIRMVLTDEQQTHAYPAASLETEMLATEGLFYSGLDSGRIKIEEIIDYPTDTYTDPNEFVQMLNGNGPKVGTGIVLKVMAGDKFNLRVSSWWKSNNTPGTPVSPLNSLLDALNNGIGSIPASHGSTTELESLGSLTGPVSDFLTTHDSYNSSKPKAFVNWILFDEQFNFVSESSGFEQVGNSDEFVIHLKTNLTLEKNGFLYVYVSNETPNIDVFFDNLQVTHIKGQILEETHYYPFGLTMAGISSKALAFGEPRNKMKYNGKELQSSEFSDGSGLEMYDYGARLQDPQLGRWWTQDKFSEVYIALTPYQYAANNPIKIIDEAGHLLKDKDGNLIATSTGNTYSRNRDYTVEGTKYRTSSTYNEVVVYTDQGTPVRALQMVSSYVEQVNADGSITKVSNPPIDASQNCHGTTFADSKLVIVDGSDNNESVQTILNEDGYVSEGVTIENADAFVMSFGGVDYHSGKINSEGTVTSDHDLAKPQTTTLEKEKNASSTTGGTKTTLYDRKGSDKQVKTKAGKVTNGVRLVSGKQANKIRKKENLNTTNQPKGTLKYTDYELQN